MDKQSDKKTNDKKRQTAQFKEKYFAEYDDVKSHTHKVIDW